MRVVACTRQALLQMPLLRSKQSCESLKCYRGNILSSTLEPHTRVT